LEICALNSHANSDTKHSHFENKAKKKHHRH